MENVSKPDTIIVPGDPLFEPSNPDEFVEHLSKTHEKLGSKNVRIVKGKNGVHLSYTMVKKGFEVPVGAHILYPEWSQATHHSASFSDCEQFTTA